MQSKEIDLTYARQYVIRQVVEAGGMLRDSFERGGYTSWQKQRLDFTTQLDKDVEDFLKGRLSREFPQTQFLAEETAPEDYQEFKKLDNLWIIDPLDGTVNFSRKHPNFAISVALVSKGEPLVGVIYVPDTSRLYWSQVDYDGAVLNNNPIEVSRVDSLNEASFICDWCPDSDSRRRMLRYLEKIITEVRQIKSMGSAVADLSSLAEGRIDAYLNPGLKPWDVAATSLIVRKAGGKITALEGGKWDIFNPDFLASNGLLHSRLIELINE